MIIIDQLIFDQLSPTLTKPKRLTKSSPPLYHQKKMITPNIIWGIKKTKAKDQNSKKEKNTQFFHTFHLVWLMCWFFFEDIYTHETKLLVFFRYFVTIVWIGYTMIQIVWYLSNLENTCSLRFLSTTTNWLASSLQKETSRNKRNKQEWINLTTILYDFLHIISN